MGEYYLASAFERIFLQRSGFVGLTGMGTERIFLKRFLDKYAIKPEIFAREVWRHYGESPGRLPHGLSEGFTRSVVCGLG